MTVGSPVLSGLVNYSICQLDFAFTCLPFCSERMSALFPPLPERRISRQAHELSPEQRKRRGTKPTPEQNRGITISLSLSLGLASVLPCDLTRFRPARLQHYHVLNAPRKRYYLCLCRLFLSICAPSSTLHFHLQGVASSLLRRNPSTRQTRARPARGQLPHQRHHRSSTALLLLLRRRYRDYLSE